MDVSILPFEGLVRSKDEQTNFLTAGATPALGLETAMAVPRHGVAVQW
jgi:hypothetical protein